MTTKDKKVVEQTAVDAKYDALSRFVDASVNKDAAGIDASITEYIIAKSKDLVAAMRAPAPVTEDSEPKPSKEDAEDKYAAMADGVKGKTRDKAKKPLKKMKKTDEAVVVEDSEPAKPEDKEDKYAAMADGIKGKTRDKAKKPLKKMKKTMEAVTPESPIRLKGDGVFVQGKQVGTLQNDMSKVHSNIIFKEMTGDNHKEFENLTDLYKHLVTKFGVEGESPLDDEGKAKGQE